MHKIGDHVVVDDRESHWHMYAGHVVRLRYAELTDTWLACVELPFTCHGEKLMNRVWIEAESVKKVELTRV